MTSTAEDVLSINRVSEEEMRGWLSEEETEALDKLITMCEGDEEIEHADLMNFGGETVKAEDAPPIPERFKKVDGRIAVILLLMNKLDVEATFKSMRQMKKLLLTATSAKKADVVKELESTKWQWGGIDEEGRGIIHFHYKLHIPSDQSVYCILKTLLMMLFSTMNFESVVRNGVKFVVWMEGSGWSNFEFAHEKMFIEVFRCFGDASFHLCSAIKLINSPWYVWAAMKLMSPFVTAEMLALIEFVDSKGAAAYTNDGASERPFIEFVDSCCNEDAAIWML